MLEDTIATIECLRYLPKIVPERLLSSTRVCRQHFLQWDSQVFMPGSGRVFHSHQIVMLQIATFISLSLSYSLWTRICGMESLGFGGSRMLHGSLYDGTRNSARPLGGRPTWADDRYGSIVSGGFCCGGGVYATVQSMVDPTQTESMHIRPGLSLDLAISGESLSAVCLAIRRRIGSRIASVVMKRRLTIWRSCMRLAHG